MRQTLNIGVIGATGFADRVAIPQFLLTNKIRIVSVHGRDERRVRETAQRHHIERWTTRIDDILHDDDVDAVYIASPVFLHAEQTIRAAEAGKHVLCEKPMALTVSECEKMIAACDEHSVLFMPAFMMRFNAAHQEIKRIIQSGRIGQVITLKAQFGFWYPPEPHLWRQKKSLSAGGALADVGSHCIDLLRYFGGDVESVVAFTRTVAFDYDVDDVSTVMLTFQSGAIGFIDVYFNARHVANRLEIIGTEGSIISERTIGGATKSNFRLMLAGNTEQYSMPETSHYVGEVEHFAECIIDNKKPRVTAEDGLRCQQIMEAAATSDESGAVVALNPSFSR